MHTTPIVSLEHVAFAYPERPALFSGLDFAMREGEHIGLHGPNGSGKTTLLRIIMGLEVPLAGRVLYRGNAVDTGETLRQLRRGVGFVLQNSDDQLFSATVLEDVAFGPLNLGLNRREARDRAMETLAGMGMEKLADRATHRLSVGEKKMVSIASVLSMRPRALLLDEPTAALDDDAKGRVLAILQNQTLARIVVAHDRDFLKRVASTFVRITAAGTVETGASLDAI